MTARTTSTSLLGLALVAVLAAGCSGGSPGDGDGNDSGDAHSSGIPIATGEWALDPDERCGDGDGPVDAVGCTYTGEDGASRLSGLAGVGSVFTSDVDVTVTYRGGLLVREPGDDPANPEVRRVLGFVDITFPDEQPRDDGLLTFSLGADGPEDLTLAVTSMGSSSQTTVWPDGSGAYSGVPYQPEPGETLTFAFYSGVAGPTELLGEDDPYVRFTSGYTYNLGPNARVSGSTYLAVLDQDPDPEVLDDVRASITKVADSWSDATGGLESFERALARWHDGEELTSVNTLGGDGAPTPGEGSDGEEGSDQGWDDDSSDVIAPPPLPEETEAAPEDLSAEELYDLGHEAGSADYRAGREQNASYFDPRPDLPDYASGYLDGWTQAERDEVDAGSSDTGRTYVQPQKITDPYIAALAMIMNLGVPTSEFVECTEGPIGSPCLTVTRHMSSGDVDHIAHVKVRMGPGSAATDYDFALLITAHDPLTDGWVVENEWTFGDGEKPAWSW